MSDQTKAPRVWAAWEIMDAIQTDQWFSAVTNFIEHSAFKALELERDTLAAENTRLREALELAIAQMKFTDSLDISENETNAPTVAMCQQALDTKEGAK